MTDGVGDVLLGDNGATVEAEEDRVVVVALRFSSHSAAVHLSGILNAIVQAESVRMQQEVELVAYCQASANSQGGKHEDFKVCELLLTGPVDA